MAKQQRVGRTPSRQTGNIFATYVTFIFSFRVKGLKFYIANLQLKKEPITSIWLQFEVSFFSTSPSYNSLTTSISLPAPNLSNLPRNLHT